MPEPLAQIIFIVGPTATGKSEVAVELAAKINAEIISCDSMQVYKGMDILTSKPVLGAMKRVPHHLISAIPARQEYNVAKYRQDAVKKIKGILKKGRVPLFVGGTGLYLSILVDGIFKTKSQNKAIRKQLYKQADSLGRESLYRKLKGVDPQAALKIHPNDTRRIIRALEVFLATGKPISQLQKERKGLSNEYTIRIFCLDMARDKLYQRIDQRVDKMFSQGLVNEVTRVLKSKLSKTASAAIGIKEVKDYLGGRYDLDQARSLIKRNSRAYAKRQLTWFRKDKRIEWIEAREKEKPLTIAKKIWKKLYSSP